MQPVRIQRKRTKGYNMQAESKAINGLECVYCGRGTKFGNPFKVEERYSELLKRNFYDVDCKNGCFCEFETKKEANNKVCKLFKILIKQNNKRYECEWSKKIERLYSNYLYCLPFPKNMEYAYLTNIWIRRLLKGKNLGCFCKLDEPCHSDILLKITNKD